MGKSMDSEERVQKSEIARKEEEILAFWERNTIFKKSEEKEAPAGEFIFYDGPPFANGLPHYGHILTSVIKDAMPRYRTMRGFRVRRRWGWDCHGLPVENLVEKELGLQTKKDIEVYGIAAFNRSARISIMKDVNSWKEIIPRIGRWVDMENDYKTMDMTYMESVWWVFNQLWGNGLIYEGFKAMHLCPRCGTTLSNFEVNLGYKDIVDFAVTVKLELTDPRRIDGRDRPASNGAHEPKTYLLVWTTTPWTLPGNMAAAVSAEIEYVKVAVADEGGAIAHYILAKDKLRDVFQEQSHEVVETMKGAALIGMSYIPPFDYFRGKELVGKENAWKIYGASYVSLEEGTGAVHLAPVYGGEDMELAQEHNIPLIHHVTREGLFTDDVYDLKGMPVKPRGDHQSADVEIIKKLAHQGLLFKKKKITHSYPLCWRCDTPLLVYAASSWFVRVASIRDRLVEENKKIRWVPKEVGERRFGNWLVGARDWAISRSRYFGAPIPVWKDEETGTCTIIGSVEELKDRVVRSGNRYFLMRHGEAELTASQIISSKADAHNALTDRGKQEVLEAVVNKLIGNEVEYIVTSPLPRTFQTALMVAKELGIPQERILVEPRLTEIGFGSYERKTIPEYHAFYKSEKARLTQAPEGGETWNAVKQRVTELLYELETQHKNISILLVGHNGPLQMLCAGAEGFDETQTAKAISEGNFSLAPSEVRELSFVPLPHDENFMLDLHRPYIDEIELQTPQGARLRRVPEVFDCWFESGSMPYGQKHYPFENTNTFEPHPGLFASSRGYPADFIAEGLDQTRGWFYSLLVLGVALFGRAPYKNVMVNGLVLAEDGQKMSKRLKNYPDPMTIIDNYGADALRYYLLSSPIVRGEDLNFSEQAVAETTRKLIARLRNVYSFFELYGSAEGTGVEVSTSNNSLDIWMLVRLKETGFEVTTAMEVYELDAATRPLLKFIDDLSTWYLRRSRDRFKGEDEVDRAQAYETLRYLLRELAKLMAPFMPFYSEELYQNVRGKEGKESVHLEAWPHFEQLSSAEEIVLHSMAEVRRLVSLALDARQASNIRVRQPLKRMSVRPQQELSDSLLALIRDEVNVKEVVIDTMLPDALFLDTGLTEELKEEGAIRELIHKIQGLRKEAGMMPTDKAVLFVTADESGRILIEKYAERITRVALLTTLKHVDAMEGTVLALEGWHFVLAIRTP